MKHLCFTKLELLVPPKKQLDFRKSLIFYYDYINVDYLSSESRLNYIKKYILNF